MCLSVIAIEPDSEWPVRLLSFREEFLARAWDPPAMWWDTHPEVVGGRDREAGGTWLAAAPRQRRAAAIHTSFVARVPPETRRTRGEITVAAAAGRPLADRDLGVYDDFTLLVLDDGGATWHSYRDGELRTQAIGAGIHLGSVAGLGPDTPRPRHKHWTDRIAAHGLPKLDGTGSPASDWPAWLERVGAAGMDPADDRALLIRRAPRGRSFGTSSVSMVAFPRAGELCFHLAADPVSNGAPAWKAPELRQ